MVETRDSRFLVESAEAAVAAGDRDAAGRLLCELAELQHASLGPDHPELAHTLNNLGVVHESLAQLDEAEACYRRAHTIAVATLASDHPFVETSGRNLREFCAANGRPVGPAVVKEPTVEELAPSSVPAATPLRVSHADVAQEPPPHETPSPPTAPRRSLRGPLVAAVCVALVVAAVLLVRLWFESRAGAVFSAGDNVRPAASPPPTSEAAVAPAPPSPPPSAPPADVATVRPALPTTERPAETGSAPLGVPVVMEARVCSRLSTAGRRWACQAVSGSTRAGTLFFYTRLKSADDAVVEHRWYQGERLHRTVELRLSANTGNGYRTFSRQTITPARAGDWRVELRAQDGTLLGEQRFSVGRSER